MLENTTTCWINTEKILSVPHTDAEYDKAIILALGHTMR